MNVLYVTYDGLEEPLGQSQVLPYVRGLAGRGHRFEIVSFEKPGVPVRWRQPLGKGVRWTALRYHKTPTVPATAFDMARGLAVTVLRTLGRQVDLIHARSYVPAALALPCAMATRVPLLFDMRGFWADEKVDGGAWPAGDWKLRAAKRVERALLRRAAAIAVLTLDAQRVIRHEYPFAGEISAPVHVIPTGADLRRFSPDVPPDPGLVSRLEGARVLGYVGSLGTWYMGETMARFYLAWREAVRHEAGAGGQRTRLLLITPADAEEVRRSLASGGVADELVTTSVPHAQVPGAIRSVEAGVAFRRPAPSSRAGAPVKVGEMLACGIPVASNEVGDIREIFRESAAGVVVRDTTDAGLREAAARLVQAARCPGVAAAARGLAARWFDLEEAVAAYDELYAAAVGSVGATRTDAGWPRPRRPRP